MMPDTELPRYLPDDEHDRRLLANVQPSDWVNPEPAGRYHLVVIGAGTAGLVTAAIGSALGARVALIERDLMGGDCLNFGCVPSKALIEAARVWKIAGEAAARFGGPAVTGEGDFGQVMARMRSLRSGISGHDSAERFRDLGVDVFLGDATFAGPDSVTVDGRTLRFRRAVIASGSRPAFPPIPGLEGSGFHTSETIFSLTRRPERLAVLGGGAIGCELGQAFARFGSRVTLFEAGDRLLPAEDADAAAIVARALANDGVEIRTGAQVTAVAVEAGTRVLSVRQGGDERRIEVDELLVATGRAPRVEGLGLEMAGIEADRSKGIVVDSRMRTANPRVYAIGDVASAQRFTHAADAQARMVVRNALFFGRGDATKLIIPRCTYTVPELAHVGIDPAAAAESGDNIETLTVAFDEVDRARLDGSAEGFLRVHLCRGTDQIAGATLVGEDIGELLPLLTHAMTAGIGLSALGDTIFTYPTRAEIIRKAADQWRRRKLTPRAQKAFATFFRLT